MSDKSQRIQKIIKQTQISFLLDAAKKMSGLRQHFEQWRNREIGLELLVESVYRDAHNLKSLALTLSFNEVDEVCQELLSVILQQKEDVWTQEKLNTLQDLTDRLIAEIERLQQD
jgi:HPt (histidine-containing phosphotransfer) domain-containing protein